MQTRNVHYAERPDDVMIRANGETAVVEFPVNVTEIEKEDVTEYVAEVVYSFETRYTADLEDRVKADYESWLDMARTPTPQQTTLADVVEALNTLTDLIIGDM